MANNIKFSAEQLGLQLEIQKKWDRVYVTPIPENEENDKKTVDILSKVFGIVSFSKVVAKEFTELQELGSWVKELFKDKVSGKTYGVRVRRTGKHNFTSKDAEKFFGDVLWDYAKGVNLTNPDVWVRLEIKDNHAYALLETYPGPGGIPTGMEGKALALFSGGIDSPVASWMMLKRGIKLDFIYLDLGQLPLVLSVFKEFYQKWCQYTPKFYVIKFPKIIEKILNIKSKYRQVILKVIMYKIAEKFPYPAFVTGESMAQASSQTLKNLAVIDSFSDKLVLRPLIGFDKNETMTLARKIETYQLSSKVPEVCNLATGKVLTSSKREEIEKIVDSLLPLEYEVKEIKIGEKEFMEYTALKTHEYDEIIKISVDNFDEFLENKPDPEKYPKNRKYLFVCETGMKAKLIAEKWRELGYFADSASEAIFTS